MTRATVQSRSQYVSSSETSRRVSDEPQDRIGGSLNASYYSKQGAWNGSGIALASQSFPASSNDTSVHESLVLYYQHHSGEIRWQRLTSEGKWVGGSQSEIVATDAKNSTPLSAIAYVKDGTSIWRLFCMYDPDKYWPRSNVYP